MAEVNKVDIGFSADVSSFNRGVDRMERKLEEFERKTTKETTAIDKRFDLMDGSMKKIDKTMGGMGDNLDMKNVNVQLEKTKKEFRETGKVGKGSLNALNNAVRAVKFDKLSQGAQKSFQVIKNDVNKLNKQVDSFNHIRFAQGFEGQNKLIASSFSKLNSVLDSSKLSLSKVAKNMSTDQVQKYSSTMTKVKNSMAMFKNELNRTGTVSKTTMAQVNNDLKAINFNKLPMSAKKAVKEVSFHMGTLNRTFDSTGTAITRSQLRMGNLSKTSKRVVNSVNNDLKVFINRINRIGVAFRNVAEVAGGLFKGTIMSSLTSIIPIAGTATTSIMGIGGALGTVAGGAIGLGGAFGISLIAIKAFTGQASSALKMLEDGQLKVTNEVKRYQSSLKGLQGDWKSLINQNQAHIFNTMSNGINMARYSLTTLNPFLVKTASQIEKASAKMHKWVTSSQNAAAAFKMLNKIGPPIFQNVLNSAGHVGNGITRIFTAFGPLFTWTGQQLEKLTKKFDTWSNSDATQRGIASFINYTKTNLPTLLSAFHNTFIGIIELFKAFSGQTAWATKGMDNLAKRFRNWAENLDKTQGFKDLINYTRANAPKVGELIGNIVDVLVQFIKAAAPIGEFMLKNMVAFTGWIAKLLEAHPVVGKLIAIMITFAGLFKVGAVVIGLMLGPLGRLRMLIMTLIGTQRAQIIMQKLFNKEQIKSKGLIASTGGGIKRLALWIKNLSIWQKIGGAAQAVWNGITAAGTAVANGYRYAIALLTTAQGRALIKTKAMGLAMKAQAIAMAIWTGITKTAALANKLLALSFKGIGTAIKSVPLIGWALAIIGALIYLWQTNATFRRIVVSTWNAIKAAAIAVFGWLKPYLTSIWNGIKFAAIWAWNAIKTAAIATWNAVKFAILHPIQTLKSGLSAIWNGIKIAAVWAWNGIKSAVMFVINSWIAVFKYQFGVLKGFLSAIWNGIKFISVAAWNGIKTAVMWVAFNFINGLKIVFSSLRAFFTAIWNGIKTSAIWAWNAIKNGVIASIRGLNVSVRVIIGTLRNWLVTAWNFIKSKVVGAARSIWTGVRSAFNYLSVAVRAIIANLRTWIIKAWTYIKSKVVGAARAIWTGVRSSFNAMSSIVRKIVGNLRVWIIKAWSYIRSKVVGFARSIWTGVRGAFNAMSSIVRKVIANLRTWLVKEWSYIRSKVVSFARSLWHGVRGAFNAMSAIVRKIVANLRAWLVKAWSYIRNKVVAFAKSLWHGVKSAFNNLSAIVRKIIANLRAFLVKAWSYIRNKVVAFAKSLWNGVKSAFNNMSAIVRKIMANLRNWLVKTWTYIKNKVVSFVKSLWHSVKNTFTSLWNGTRNIFNKVKNYVVNLWKGIKNSVTGFVKSMWNGVRNTMNKMRTGISGIAGKIKSTFKSMVSGVVDGLNKLIRGVNWVGKKLGMKALKEIKLSTGTQSTHTQKLVSNGKLKQDTMATLGDKGRGNGSGGFRNEIVELPNGNRFMTPSHDVTMPLPAKTKVYSGAQTQAAGLPKFHEGTGASLFGGGGLSNSKPKKKKKGDNVFGDAWDATKAGAAKVVNGGKAIAKKTVNAAVSGGIWLKDKIGDIEDWFDKPKKLLNKVLEGYGVGMKSFKIPKAASLPYDMMSGMYGKLKKSALDKITGWIEEQSGGDGGYIDLSKGINFGFANSAAEAAKMGYPFPRAHHGLDINYGYGSKLYSTLAGTADGRSGYNGGFGNSMWIDAAGGIRAIYGHMSKLAWNGKRKVKPGDYIGKSGGDPARQGAGAGDSTGPQHKGVIIWQHILNDSLNPLSMGCAA